MSMPQTRTPAEDIRRTLDRPIVLVGMMGAGKSKLGRLLSRALDLDFVDSDEEIEKAAGMSITEIFDRFGEPYFRDGERRVVRRLLDGGVRVVATGGGAMMNAETADAVATESISIWVRADIELMAARTGRSDKRPLLRGGDPATIMRDLYEVREPTYARAAITVDSRDGPGEDMLAQALDGLYAYLYNRRA
jgi:shikimate kinase